MDVPIRVGNRSPSSRGSRQNNRVQIDEGLMQELDELDRE